MSNFTKAHILESELAVVKAQNDRLNQENALLREKLNRLTTNQRSTAASNVEAKVRAYQLENERDEMFQNLEKLKKKYEKLHEAYCAKVKRCKVLENTFERQKTLTGLVMKSAIKQRNEEQNAILKAKENSGNLEIKIANLQKALDESHETINELEFELETIDLLEVENQRLHKELNELKEKYDKLCKSSKRVSTRESPPPYSEVELTAGTSNRYTHRLSETGELDTSTMERSILTDSFLKDAEMESNALRRELLKCRLQNSKETNAYKN